MTSGPPGLWIDWDDDGFATGDYDNLSSLVISAHYSRGGTPEITGAAQAGQGLFVVKNPDGLFDPDNASGPLYGKLHDGPRVWWGVNSDGTIVDKGATVRGRFAGRITDVAPIPVAGAGGSTPTAEIVCEDPLGWYGRTPVVLSDNCSPAPAPAHCSDFTPTGRYLALSAVYGYVTGDYNPNGSPLWCTQWHLDDANGHTVYIYERAGGVWPSGTSPQFPWLTGTADYGGADIYIHIVGDGTGAVHTTGVLPGGNGPTSIPSFALYASSGPPSWNILSTVGTEPPGTDITFTATGGPGVCDHWYILAGVGSQQIAFLWIDWTAS